MLTLNSARTAAGAELAHARTAHSQAEAIDRLAHAQEQATAAVRKIVPESRERSANAAIATALAEMGRGYSTMVLAARGEDRHDYEHGREVVTTATNSLAAVFAQLHRLGYRLGDERS